MYHEETNINPDANHNSKEWNDKNNGNPWRPPTPPRDNNHRTSSGMERDRPSTFLPPSPPLNGLEINSSDSLEKKKHDHKSWTLKDDKILLHHVLSRLHGGRWQEAETKLGGRHTARQCAERWQHLKKLLLKGIDKTGTQGWVK
ncbi:hypothetical protein EC973_000959 [Apophysomyces ossiformis]|uniref:Myb-like domain-containing protein n=1 Tax=Apophysomyces ossiformis TaxID=679940 RepID=A0A8H7BPN0_9FUNG|nr:hypothetical protein EC973_000959 [Apophysomyces ossiformis]